MLLGSHGFPSVFAVSSSEMVVSGPITPGQVCNVWFDEPNLNSFFRFGVDRCACRGVQLMCGSSSRSVMGT